MATKNKIKSGITARYLKVMADIIATERARKGSIINYKCFYEALGVGISPSVVTHYRTQGRHVNVTELGAMCAKFNVNGHYLLTGEGEVYLSAKENEVEHILKRLSVLLKRSKTKQ